MNVIFDFELIDSDRNIWNEMSDEEYEMFKIIKEFYESRLMPLKEEMEEQEAKEDGKYAIVIHTMDDPIKTSMHGYSHNLIDKINECFSKNDFEYLNTLLYRKNQARNN